MVETRPAIEKILKLFLALMSYFVSKDSDYSNALKDLLLLTGLEDEENIKYLEYSKSSCFCSIFTLVQTVVHFLKSQVRYCNVLTHQLNYLPL